MPNGRCKAHGGKSTGPRTPEGLKRSEQMTSSRLADYPFDMVRLACEKCTRKGQYLKSSLMRRFGPDQDIVDLRLILAADCPKVIANRATHLCSACYPDRIGR
jgi:hypothetical protein